MNTAEPGQQVHVCYRDLIGPADASRLQQQLEQLHGAVFGRVPSLPSPSTIDHILVLIKNDLSCTAYVNELNFTAQVKTTRAIDAGALVYPSDISDVTSANLGVEVPVDVGIALVRSHGWRRSLFFDFGPLLADVKPRTYSLDQALAQQVLLLLGIAGAVPNQTPSGGRTRLDDMLHGVQQLREMITSRCEIESNYQELLEEHPWMLAGNYKSIVRHKALDDSRIPDFTGLRNYDECHDVIELKQPFLKLFRQDGGFSAYFNEAWNQAEGYLSFVLQENRYLRDQKGLRFENPRCLLLIGHDLSERELAEIRRKESLGRVVSVLTYEQLLRTAEEIVSLVRRAGEPIRPVSGVDG